MRILEPFRDRPWLGWLMVCLARQSVRQDWLRQVARTRLQDVVGWNGQVPDLPGWTFEFHGVGLCLTGPGGEVLDCSLEHDRIDPWFFARRVLWLDPAPPPEEHLRRYFPAADLMVAALRPLREEGYLVGEPAFELRPDWRAAAPEVAAFEGPWPFREGDFAAFLVDLVRDRAVARRCLAEALPLLDPARRLDVCRQVLPGTVDAATGHAVDALLDFPEALQDVLALMRRLSPAKHHPYTACCVARYLLAHGRRSEAVALVARFAAVEKVEGYYGNPMDDEYAFLLLEGAPEHALPYVRKALRSRIPAAVANMAALLSLLDQPWTRRELLAALEEASLGVTERRYLAAALSRSGDLDARRRALQLAPGPPDHDPDAAGFTYDEVIANSLPELLGHVLEAQRPRAARLAEVRL